MSISKRIEKIEEKLNKDQEVIFRLIGCDGHYPEEKEDRSKSCKVIKIYVEDISCEELRSWAE